MSVAARRFGAILSIALLTGCVIQMPPGEYSGPAPASPVYTAPTSAPSPIPVEPSAPPPPATYPVPPAAAPAPTVVYMPPPPPEVVYAPPPEPPPPRYTRRQVEDIINDAYRDVLDRAPDRWGFEKYRGKLLRDNWSREAIIRDLQGSEEARAINPDQAIRKAYREVLGREPDPAGLSHYREMWRRGWTQGHVRTDLRNSAETRDRTIREAITRSYRDLLGRAPDADGFAHYSALMRDHGWSEDQVRIAIMKSPEYRASHR